MGTSQQAISRIESGGYEGFTLTTLEKVAEAEGAATNRRIQSLDQSIKDFRIYFLTYSAIMFRHPSRPLDEKV
jgi:hypothetical protein